MTKHSPLPWHVTPNAIGVQTADGVQFCQNVDFEASDMLEADAEFIVRAVNCHDELVAALKEMQSALEALLRSNPDATVSALVGLTVVGAREKATKALALAEGREAEQA